MTLIPGLDEVWDDEANRTVLSFQTFTDGDLREAIRPASGDTSEAHVATLCSDGNVVWYSEWCTLDELEFIAAEFSRVWKARNG